MNLGKYSKFWLAAIAVVVSWVTLVSKPPTHVTSHEVIILVSGLGAAVTTLLLPNWSGWIWKALGNFIVGLTGWFVLVADSAPADVTATEWAALLTVVATALGVYAVANASSSQVDARGQAVG